MLRNGAASLHGSTNVQKVCRIHEGRGHLSRRQLTSRAFNARVHSSLYKKHGAGHGGFVDVATRPGPRDQARATQEPPGTQPDPGLQGPSKVQNPSQEAPGGRPEAQKVPPEAPKRLPRSPQREHAGTKTREDKTTGDTTRGDHRRRRQEKPRQEKTKATEACTR